MIAYETCNYKILNEVNFNCAAFNNEQKKSKTLMALFKMLNDKTINEMKP